MKKIMTVLTMALVVVMMSFCLVGCGGKDEVVTASKYQELRQTAWTTMSPTEMEEFLGVKYVENADATEMWGEGYLVADFPGEDEDSKLHVLFAENDDGTWRTCSMQPIGKVAA